MFTFSFHLLGSYSLIIDALFGFSFQANSLNDIRTPYDVIIAELTKVQDQVHILAVDVPSGWNVDKGKTNTKQHKPKKMGQRKESKLLKLSLILHLHGQNEVKSQAICPSFSCIVFTLSCFLCLSLVALSTHRMLHGL